MSFRSKQRLRVMMGVEMADGTSQVCKIVMGRELYGREFPPH